MHRQKIYQHDQFSPEAEKGQRVQSGFSGRYGGGASTALEGDADFTRYWYVGLNKPS